MKENTVFIHFKIASVTQTTENQITGWKSWYLVGLVS